MTETHDEAGPLRRVEEEEEIDRLHAALEGFLHRMVMERFGVPSDDATVLVHDVFSAYLTMADRLGDPAEWLIAVACRSASDYYRAHDLAQGSVSPPDAKAEERRIRRILFLQTAVATLPEHEREVARRFYAKGMTYAEIAAELGVPEPYVKNALKKATLRLRKLERQVELR